MRENAKNRVLSVCWEIQIRPVIQPWNNNMRRKVMACSTGTKKEEGLDNRGVVKAL